MPERDRDRDRDHDRHRDRDRGSDRGRDRDRDRRDRDRGGDRDRDRRDRGDRDRRRSRSRSPNHSRDREQSPGFLAGPSGKHPENANLTEEEKQMQEILGFAQFHTTKGEKDFAVWGVTASDGKKLDDFDNRREFRKYMEKKEDLIREDQDETWAAIRERERKESGGGDYGDRRRDSRDFNRRDSFDSKRGGGGGRGDRRDSRDDRRERRSPRRRSPSPRRRSPSPRRRSPSPRRRSPSPRRRSPSPRRDEYASPLASKSYGQSLSYGSRH